MNDAKTCNLNNDSGKWKMYICKFQNGSSTELCKKKEMVNRLVYRNNDRRHIFTTRAYVRVSISLLSVSRVSETRCFSQLSCIYSRLAMT